MEKFLEQLKLKPYLIAEVGSNWFTQKDCEESIIQAKYAGADAVKFQLYTGEELYGLKMDIPHSLPREWISKLKERADRVKIDFMCTGFSPDGYKFIDPFVNVHKVASAEMCHKRILEVCNRLKKPTLISSGGHTLRDMGYAMHELKDTLAIPMYCVSRYPATVIDFRQMQAMKTQFNTVVGYSDHSVDALNIPLKAIQEGARIIEKHFKLERISNTPDSPHSLNEKEFRLMYESINNCLRPLYAGAYGEESMLTFHNRRLLTTCKIAAGEKFKLGVNYGEYRSLKEDAAGLHPFLCYETNGRVAKKDKLEGEGISPNDFV